MKGKFFATGIFLILGIAILFMIIPSPYNANMNTNVGNKVFADDGDDSDGDDGGDKQGSSNDEQDSNDAPQEDKQETNEEVNDEPKEDNMGSQVQGDENAAPLSSGQDDQTPPPPCNPGIQDFHTTPPPCNPGYPDCRHYSTSM